MKINPFRIILAVLILAIPLYPKFPLNSISGTYVNIRLDDILVLISVIFWLVYQLKNKFSFLKEKPTFLIFLYWSSLLLSAFGAILVYKIDPTNQILLHTFRRFQYMSLFFVSLLAINHKKDLNFIYVFALLTVVLTSLYGLGQKYFSLPVVSTMNEEFSKGQLLTISTWTRINSTFAGHYDLAVFMSVILIIIYSQSIFAKSKINKTISFLVFLLGFYILTLTASRVSMAAFWLSACLCFWLLKKYFWIIPTTLLVFFTILSSKDLNQRLQATFPSLGKEVAVLTHEISQITLRFSNKSDQPVAIKPTPTTIPTPATISSLPIPDSNPKIIPTIVRIRPAEDYPPVDVDAGVARSGEIRFKVEWPRAINAFWKNIFQGTGPSSLGLATDNDFLRTLGESGLFGITSFFLIFYWFFRQTLKNRSTLNIIFLCATICMFINAIFIDVFAASKTAYMFWIMMAIYRKSLNFKNES